MPMSHHGAARPDVKNSVVLDPARRISQSAGANDTIMDAMTIVQSRVLRCIYVPLLSQYAVAGRGDERERVALVVARTIGLHPAVAEVFGVRPGHERPGTAAPARAEGGRGGGAEAARDRHQVDGLRYLVAQALLGIALRLCGEVTDARDVPTLE